MIEREEPTATERLEQRVAKLERAAEPEPAPPTQADVLNAAIAKGRRKRRAALASIGIETMEPEPEAEPEPDDSRPDFDGGAREPAPLPSDPEAEHGELVSELLAANQVHRGPLRGWRLG